MFSLYILKVYYYNISCLYKNLLIHNICFIKIDYLIFLKFIKLFIKFLKNNNNSLIIYTFLHIYIHIIAEKYNKSSKTILNYIKIKI